MFCRYGGAIPLVALYASIRVLYSVRAVTGSQWRERRRGVTCENLGWLKTRRAAAFWIIWRGLSVHAGRPVSRELQ